MVSLRCKLVVKEALESLGLHFVILELGIVEIMQDLTEAQHTQLYDLLLKSGLELMDDKKSVLIEKIKNIIIEMVHYSDELPKVTYSDYISEKMGLDYTYLSKLFSEVRGITIEHFIIAHKIERVKELIMLEDSSIKEISYLLHYSSPAHLSNQFKKITGLTPSHFKTLKEKRRLTIQEI